MRNELYHHHQHFYPRPPRGGRRSSSAWQAIRAQFLSTPSARRATPGQTPGMPRPLHFYPRPPRGGRLPLIDGADTLRDFYPRPPRGGRRGIRDMTVLERLFLSTPSARRATVSVVDLDETAEFLSTPSARRATWLSSLSARRWRISIHALREEGDKRVSPDAPPDCISIHALREEGDILILRVGLFFFYFYPRPPRGGRLTAITRRCSMARFLSTPSARRATVNLLRQPSFSIYFYPRPPRGGRHIIQDYVLEGKKFLSTPSARRATRACNFVLTDIKRFLSTPSARRATDILDTGKLERLISIHALREEGDLRMMALI